MRCYDTRTLRREGRALSPPFQLMLGTQDKPYALTCTALLRHLPGKRLVGDGVLTKHGRVVAKIFLDPSGAERHCLRELQGIQALQAARIPTPDLVWQGALADGQAPLLLFRYMEGFENLTERLFRAANDAQRRETLQMAVGSIARLHAAGLRQRDIHPGNFLLSDSQIMIIDGDDVEKPGPAPLPRRASLSNLALFFAQFYPAFDALVPQVIASYTAGRQWPPDALAARALQDEIRHWRAWRLKKFLPKTRRTCSAFIVTKAWQRFTACDREWYVPAWQPLLENPDAFIPAGTILKAGNSATVAHITIGSQAVVVKRYNIKNAVHALRRGLRTSRAMVSWRNAQRLRFLGIATPRPLAVIEERWGGLRKKAYFIMAHQPGQTIDQALRAAIADPHQVKQLLTKLETLLGQLAAARISHGDCKATNFLLSSGRLYLVDLDGMRAHRRRSTFRRAFRRDMRRLVRNWQDLPDVQRELEARIETVIASIDG
jgi:tRNA A-37 threonylcarbamoyl transferase component Bud32